MAQKYYFFSKYPSFACVYPKISLFLYYEKDDKGVGGYDDMLNQYGGYEQKKTRIQEQYAERRRIAELNGNTQLLQQLALAFFYIIIFQQNLIA